MRQPEVVGSNPTKRVASQFCAKNDGSSTKNIFFYLSLLENKFSDAHKHSQENAL
jgi:hypothetical protein